MVVATATPKMNGPENSATAVTPRATRGENAREEIMVATMLLESWMPLSKSNPRPSTITTMRRGVMDGVSLFYVLFTTISAMTLAASSPRSAALLR